MASSTLRPSGRTSKRGRGRSASGVGDDESATGYEKQRLSRIRENQERLEALGLRGLATALLGSSGSGRQGQDLEVEKAGTSRRRRKKKEHGGNANDEDVEYRPSEEEEVDGNSSSGEDNAKDKEKHAFPQGSRRPPKGKKKASSDTTKDGKGLHIQSNMDQLEDMDDDAALRQAIALSLQEPTKCSTDESNLRFKKSNSGYHGQNNDNNIQEASGKGKRRKANARKPQMTEDQLIAFFFSFDEAGKGNISIRDLARMAAAHDFCWTEKEIADMIHLFDSNRDGQLSLDDFRSIVSRCNMIRESGDG